MNLNQKTVLVTGANRGIGLAIVNSLLGKGVKKIYAAARDPKKLPDFNDGRVVPLKLDIDDIEQIEAAAVTASDVDLLINNAGVAAFTSLLTGPRELLERDMNTNYYGTLDMVRAFVPVLETKRDAVIVNIATIAAFTNFAPKGIAVHTVNPGPIDTEMAREFDMEKSSPESTADNILAGLESDEADIFPDIGGRQMFDIWSNDYRDLEEMVNQMTNSA